MSPRVELEGKGCNTFLTDSTTPGTMFILALFSHARPVYVVLSDTLDRFLVLTGSSSQAVSYGSMNAKSYSVFTPQILHSTTISQTLTDLKAKNI